MSKSWSKQIKWYCNWTKGKDCIYNSPEAESAGKQASNKQAAAAAVANKRRPMQKDKLKPV